MADYARRVSFNERIYLAEERGRPGFCIQLVVEGDGDVDEARLRAAVERAADANPGARLVRRGVLGWMRWVARGPVPPVRRVEWTQDPPPALDVPLPPDTGPTCEVVTAPGRVVFRCFHGVMDARGLLHFAEDVFRALRDEPLVGSDYALSDTEFVESEVGRPRRPPPRNDCPPLSDGGTSTWPSRVVWRRVTLEGPPPPALVARLATLVADVAKAPVRLMIPVDVRNYRRSIRATGNLSYPLFLDVDAGRSWRDLHKTVLKKLQQKEPLRLDPAERVLPWLPMGLVGLIYRLWIGSHRRAKRFPFTALLSHVALPGGASLDGGGFRARALYVLPMKSDIFPLTVAVATGPGRVDLVFSAPDALFDEAGLARLAETARACLADAPSAESRM